MLSDKNSTVVLTSARGIAAWWVVLYHFREVAGLSENSALYFLISKGHLAVDFFFILSGFVIYLNYNEWFFKKNRKDYYRFIGYRLSRIYPLYLIVLLLFLANPIAIYFFSSSGDLGDRYSPEYYFASIFMIQNWGFMPKLAWNIPAWSISTEFAAYLAFPFVSPYISKLKVSITTYGLALGLTGVLLQCFHLANEYGALGDNIPHTGLIRCFSQFFLGCLCAKFYIAGYFDNVNQTKLIIFALIVLFLKWLKIISGFYAVPTLSSIILILLLKYNRDFLTSRPFILIGEISYSTYIIHYFIKDWVKFLINPLASSQFTVYLITTFISSFILYKYIEVPFRAYFKNLTNRILT